MIRINKLLLAVALMALPYAPSSCQTAPTELAAPIAPSGGTLDAAGSYYLGFDVTGDITIGASNVILDLNGHLVTGSINVAMDLSDVTVMNGFVTTSAANGIDIATGCSNINLNNLTVRYSGTTFGIGASGTNVTIKDVTLLGTSVSTGLGLELNTCTNAVVCNCSIVGDSTTGVVAGLGFFVTSCSGVLLEECRVRNCTNSFQFSSNSSDVTVSHCIAFSGTNGFVINSGNGKSLQLLNCIADNCGVGFTIFSGVQPVYLEECNAYNNTGDGFSVDNSVAHTVKKCVATGNDDGFVDAGGSDLARYIANYADGNTTDNYNPTSGDPFRPKSANSTSSPKAQFWRNTIRPDSSNDCS